MSLSIQICTGSFLPGVRHRRKEDEEEEKETFGDKKGQKNVTKRENAVLKLELSVTLFTLKSMKC